MDITGKRIGLDTNIFIYYFNSSEQFGEQVKNIFKKLIDNKSLAITSIITFIEILSLGAKDIEIDKLKNILLQIPNLKICNLNQDIGEKSAKIRRDYGYSIPDSIQIATALIQKVDLFITNDNKLLKFKEIPIVSLNQINII